MIIDTSKLKTIANYAKAINRTPTHIMWLIKHKGLQSVLIDGKRFIVVD
jgi:hypothetical protein